MKRQDVDALQAMIDALREYPNMDEITFVDFMRDNFGTVEGDIEYEFIHTTSPHLHVIRMVAEDFEITFTWSCSEEVLTELQWFTEHFAKEE